MRERPSGQAGALPCDLEIRVRTPWGRERDSLEVEVHSPSGALPYHHHRVSGLGLRDPEAFRRHVLAKLEHLGRGLDLDEGPLRARDVQGELVSLGHDLFREIFRGELLAIYRECRDAVRTLLVTTDEPWIPWELLHSAEPEDDFFCARFEMGRWLAGNTTPVGEKAVRKALLLGGDGDLRGAQLEIRDLGRRLERRPGLVKTTLCPAQFREVSAHLEAGDCDLVHYAGHGLHTELRGDESRLALADRPFRAHHLSPAWIAASRKTRPIVVSNSCKAARIEPSLVGLDGWPARWVQVFGCSAFVAPLWSVRDSAGRIFSSAFYEALLRGRTLAQAVLEGRRAIRTAQPHSLSWLAYMLYGHPNTRVRLGHTRQTAMGVRRTAIARRFGDPTRPPTVTPVAEGGEPLRERPPRSSHSGSRSPDGHVEIPEAPGRRASLGAFAAAGLLVSWVLGWIDVGGEVRLRDHPGPSETHYPAATNPAPPEALSAGPGGRTDLPLASPESWARPPFPSLPIERGLWVVLGLDADTGQPNREVARAARSLLFERLDDLGVSIPGHSASSAATLEWVEELLEHNARSLALDGRGPWGAEWVLALSVRREPIPDPHEYPDGLGTATHWVLISALEGRIEAVGTSHGTALVTTDDEALVMALEKCLEPLFDHFESRRAPASLQASTLIEGGP